VRYGNSTYLGNVTCGGNNRVAALTRDSIAVVGIIVLSDKPVRTLR
jgi:hypothetical protein